MDRCPYSYYLNRVLKVWKKPAAWLPQGTAFHEVAEFFELSGKTVTLREAQQRFTEIYAREVNKLTAETPNFKYWFRSGPYDGETDVGRRHTLGLSQVESYLEYSLLHPEERISATPSGEPMIELPFDVKFGEVRVRGYIDQVINRRPRDLKTGKTPGGDHQLATYAGALHVEYGVPFSHGDFWMAQKPGPTKPYDLTDWSIQRLSDEYGEISAQIDAGDFPAKPSEDRCTFCSVQKSCKYSMASGW
jgi:putative RecB family exonuclease